ncbi:hypothetical protein TCSYLVIO_007984, partial [Trypanosoma cruzi]
MRGTALSGNEREIERITSHAHIAGETATTSKRDKELRNYDDKKDS